MSINKNYTMVDIVDIEMVDFDFIVGMDCLHASHASIDCTTQVVKFKIPPNEPVIKWGSSSLVPKVHFVSYLKARNLISKVCIYQLAHVNESYFEVRCL